MIFEVKITKKFYVKASNKTAAALIFDEHEDDILRSEPLTDLEVNLIKDINEVEKDARDTLPWNFKNDSSITIAEIMENK